MELQEICKNGLEFSLAFLSLGLLQSWHVTMQGVFRLK
jgi:hypothetical protein